MESCREVVEWLAAEAIGEEVDIGPLSGEVWVVGWLVWAHHGFWPEVSGPVLGHDVDPLGVGEAVGVADADGFVCGVGDGVWCVAGEGEEGAVVIGVLGDGETGVADAGDAEEFGAGLFDRGEDGKEDGDEERDDGDDGEEFGECECFGGHWRPFN